MNKLQIVIDYINAMEKQSNADDKFAEALKLLNADNYTMGTAENISTAYSKLLKKIIGADSFDWLTWWMWECDFGKKPNSLFWIKEVKYDASGLSFKEFWGLVNDNS